ncbi:ATP-binding protein [Pedobacter sp. SYSU D00535]|uniref:ATP-binding protein n=1 Tax=Pedobacter sp. SYSU D00535 TaxID=2810308 RepID=UPI001A9745AC|nr:ATP-binding protein [Pedobacter sp. SYSU D00535]
MLLHKNTLIVSEDIRKEFLFNNQTASMGSLLNEMTAFLKIHLPSEAYDDKISSCKQIIIELLTNAVKHSEAENTTVSVAIGNNRIEISKSDTGRKFYLAHYSGIPPLNLPFRKEYVGGRIKIYEDDISHLYSIIHNENRIVFELLEYPIEDVNVETNLLEHYGLLILTKLSNEFFYTFDPVTGSNIFTTVVHLS